MDKKNKKILVIAIWSGIITAIVAAVIINAILNRFRYNKEGEVANTTGNLYNRGLFCEYNGYVYFSNPADDNSLYRMKSDGTEQEKLHADSVSYIQVINDYIYYIRLNETSVDMVLRGQPYGIYRLEIGDDKAEKVYNGLVKSMRLIGNYIYFQAYDDENLIQLKKIKVDGTELKLLTDKDYEPIAVYGNEIYFPEVSGNHNLKRLVVSNDNIETAKEGNFYRPLFIDGFMYYIDLNSNMQLKRINLSNNETTTLDEGRCINYNVSKDNDVIYYQLENEDDHELCRMKLDGTGKMTIMKGNCKDINITKNYTYFYKLIGTGAKESVLYRVETKGNIIQEVKFGLTD